MNKINSNKKIALILILSSFGYFVDIYGLVLFIIVRVPSLQEFGLEGNQLLNKGILLLNMQMLGMIVGGILWAIIGDKNSRIAVLFGSVFALSIANIANGFVEDITTYALLRFIAGVGLAGELGAGLTIATEMMQKEIRGYGKIIIATAGIFGAVVAVMFTDIFLWRTAYFIGGGLGILLLIIRFGVSETGLYRDIKFAGISREHFFAVFKSKILFLKYIYSISIGIPIWFIVGILVAFAPEFAKELKLGTSVNAGTAVVYCYIGLILGDFISGSLSHIFKSRKKIINGFIAFTAINIVVYLFFDNFHSDFFYFMCFMLGISGGYWALFVSYAGEQFDTDMRATVTATAANFARGAFVIAALFFRYLTGPLGLVFSALLVGLILILVAFLASRNLDETYRKETNYLEIN